MAEDSSKAVRMFGSASFLTEIGIMEIAAGLFLVLHSVFALFAPGLDQWLSLGLACYVGAEILSYFIVRPRLKKNPSLLKDYQAEITFMIGLGVLIVALLGFLLYLTMIKNQVVETKVIHLTFVTILGISNLILGIICKVRKMVVYGIVILAMLGIILSTQVTVWDLSYPFLMFGVVLIAGGTVNVLRFLKENPK
ncbi:MAG: hypothetical protein LHW64_07760 [Candidatus Cloacimonetes bacterium]|jgi:hypothetical protein|nr:hypothetical protein [Candidatus Cloacimonadota bacterium]MCB5287685.1 hypothetical protein [Candidatus Cloacimonadota bacterium]MCK9184606.1 hypothetical protein [Candidatus Cloacimonadota bacterium]MCK9585220.1 hypothetical protein [Candidatus Cloacimonadota bacterium]MDY0230006.1 hypothetical protein [Candidatus Cloacimonadaceae bacterium]